MKETNFNAFKENFDLFCKDVNDEKQSVTLSLKNNRKVYIIPDENYKKIERFSVTLSPQPFHK